MKVRKPRAIYYDAGGMWVKIRPHSGTLWMGFDDSKKPPRLSQVRRLHNWLGRYIAWREQEGIK